MFVPGSGITNAPLQLPFADQTYHDDDNRKLPMELLDGILNNTKQNDTLSPAVQESAIDNAVSAISGYPSGSFHYPTGQPSSTVGTMPASGGSSGSRVPSGLDILTHAAAQSIDTQYYDGHMYPGSNAVAAYAGMNSASYAYAEMNGYGYPAYSAYAVHNEAEMKPKRATKSKVAKVQNLHLKPSPVKNMSTPGNFGTTRRVSCDACGNAKKKCNREEVCQNCIKWGTQCVYSIRKNPGTANGVYRNAKKQMLHAAPPPIVLDPKLLYPVSYNANVPAYNMPLYTNVYSSQTGSNASGSGA